MSVEIGKTYIITHSRKGSFIGKIVKDKGEFIDVLILKGRAEFISFFNQDRGMPGDVISIRKSFCTFKEEEGSLNES